MRAEELGWEGKTFEGRGATLEEALHNAAHQSVARDEYGSPRELRLVELRVVVENPITEYRAIFIPTG
jgi:hypothetical protein